MSAPAASKTGSAGGPGRWVNPCGIPGHPFDGDRDMEGAPEFNAAENYQNIVEAANAARIYAIDTKKKFMNSELPGSDLDVSGSDYRQQWLPVIPKATEENFRSINQTEAYRKSFEFLQYFAVGIEKIMLDQLRDGKFIHDFQTVENYLTQVLCQLQLGMYALKIQPNADVTRDVMSQKYRDIEDGSRRSLRDFLILRDYIQATNFVKKLFAYMHAKLQQDANKD